MQMMLINTFNLQGKDDIDMYQYLLKTDNVIFTEDLEEEAV